MKTSYYIFPIANFNKQNIYEQLKTDVHIHRNIQFEAHLYDVHKALHNQIISGNKNINNDDAEPNKIKETEIKKSR